MVSSPRNLTAPISMISSLSLESPVVSMSSDTHTSSKGDVLVGNSDIGACPAWLSKVIRRAPEKSPLIPLLQRGR